MKYLIFIIITSLIIESTNSLAMLGAALEELHTASHATTYASASILPYYIDTENHRVLVLLGKHSGKWSDFGGNRDIEENDPRITALRELDEETAQTIEPDSDILQGGINTTETHVQYLAPIKVKQLSREIADCRKYYKHDSELMHTFQYSEDGFHGINIFFTIKNLLDHPSIFKEQKIKIKSCFPAKAMLIEKDEWTWVDARELLKVAAEFEATFIDIYKKKQKHLSDDMMNMLINPAIQKAIRDIISKAS